MSLTRRNTAPKAKPDWAAAWTFGEAEGGGWQMFEIGQWVSGRQMFENREQLMIWTNKRVKVIVLSFSWLRSWVNLLEKNLALEEVLKYFEKRRQWEWGGTGRWYVELEWRRETEYKYKYFYRLAWIKAIYVWPVYKGVEYVKLGPKQDSRARFHFSKPIQDYKSEGCSSY